MGDKRNLGVGTLFAAVGVLLGVIAPYMLVFISDQEFIHLLKILFIIILILLGGLLTATGIIILLPADEE